MSGQHNLVCSARVRVFLRRFFAHQQFRRIVHVFASLKLAVLIIVSIGVVTAWGTIVEAQYDAAAANKLVYSSIWMLIPMVMLVVCLTAVMIDRWPWQKRHTGFVLAHIGIIILLLGSLITQKFGIDGSVTFGPGEKAQFIVVGNTDLSVHASLDGSTFRKLFDREVDFFLRPANVEPVIVSIPEGEIRVVDSYRYALREQKFVERPADEKAGAAIRFQLQNPNVNMTEWMLQPAKGAADTKDLGPAQILLVAKFPRDFGGRNAIVIKPADDTRIEYNIHSARTGTVKRGFAAAGDEVETGWMGLKFRLLKYMPRAEEEITYRPVDRPTELTTAAVKIEYKAPGTGKVTTQWMGLNSRLKLFSERQVYIVSYGNRRLPLAFDMHLKEFKIGHYQGTLRAASYESLVSVAERGNESTKHETTISMNEPLKKDGLTFYQASFVPDPATGKPVASVLSVNQDPGRALKYFGSLLIVLGTLHLFYMKRRAWMAKALATAGEKAS